VARRVFGEARCVGGRTELKKRGEGKRVREKRKGGGRGKRKADADELLKGTFERTPWPGVFIKILSIF